MKQWQKELEKQHDWQKKGKQYKTKYFSALKALYGAIEHDKESQFEGTTNREAGTDKICGVVKEAGV